MVADLRCHCCRGADGERFVLGTARRRALCILALAVPTRRTVRHPPSAPPPLPCQILLRKGGIKEPTFKPAAAEFLLFPTSFHTEAEVRGWVGGQRAQNATCAATWCITLPSAPTLDLATHCLAPLPPLRPPPSQLLTPSAAQRYADECGFDPKAQAQLAFGTRCVLTGAWTTKDPSVLAALEGLHVWAPTFLVG